MAETKKKVAKLVSSAAERPVSRKGERKSVAKTAASKAVKGTKGKSAKAAVTTKAAATLAPSGAAGLALRKSEGKTKTAAKAEAKVAKVAPAKKATTVTKSKPPTVRPKPAAKATTQPTGNPLGSARGNPLGSARGKRYRELRKLVDRDQLYALEEAVKLAQETSNTKFDGTIELHIRLGVDARQAEQSVRGTVKLPAGTGKERKVLAFVSAAKHTAAKKAGAEFVSDEATLKKIKDGWTGFDVAVATPDQMAEVAKFGSVLGPKGLMPNPKSGTVSDKPDEAIAAVKAGSVEFRVAKDATIHTGVGKASFATDDLVANTRAYLRALHDVKPSGTKGSYFRSVTLSATMGPGIRVDTEMISPESQKP